MAVVVEEEEDEEEEEEEEEEEGKGGEGTPRTGRSTVEKCGKSPLWQKQNWMPQSSLENG